MRPTPLLAVLLLPIALAAPGCRRPAEPADRLVVFAAASLRDGFTALGEPFRRAHPGVEVRFNFAGTQELRTQVEHGAALDVFASADPRHLRALAEAGLVEPPVVFARNELVLAVAHDAAATVRSLADLPQAGRVVIGAAEVPVGRYTLEVLDRAGAVWGADFRARVEAKVVSRELNVRQVLTKVSLGEADVGLVYRSDVASAPPAVVVVALPPEVNVVAEYPIAIATHAPRPALARSWVELVQSVEGQAALTRAGFLAAPQAVVSP